MSSLRIEIPLLGLLALLWGSSYLFIKIAVAEIPPVTLIAARVFGATLFLLVVVAVQGIKLPRDSATWRMLGIQAFFNSIGAWVVLAWGQQYVDSGLASVLNSTAPVFVFIFIASMTRHERQNLRKLSGAILGVLGVVLIVGVDALNGLGQHIAGQLACLSGAILYACAAIYGKRFASLGAVSTATCTMIIASLVLVPTAFVIDKPLDLSPSPNALYSVFALSLLCTGVAMLLYFRLLNTLGSMGVASQAYLRASVGVLLGMTFLNESLSVLVSLGLIAAIVGVALINWPIKPKTHA